MEYLDHISSSLLIERRNIETDHLSIVVWVDTQVRLLNSFFNISEQPALIGLNDDETRLRNADLRYLINRSRCSIIVNLNALHQSSTSSSGTNGRKVLAQSLNGFFHTSLRIVENICCHSNAPLVTELFKKRKDTSTLRHCTITKPPTSTRYVSHLIFEKLYRTSH